MQISINLFLTQARGSHSYRLVKEATRLLIERKSRADDKRIGSLPANMYSRYELIAADQSINLPAKLDFGFVHKEYQSNESYRPKILENRDLPKELPPFPAFSKDIGRHFGEGRGHVAQNAVHISISGMEGAFQLSSHGPPFADSCHFVAAFSQLGSFSHFTFFVQNSISL